MILLDEIEKAHPDVFNVLLQVLDDGRLTDGKGRTVDFKNTILILTSNLGSEYIAGEHGEITDEVRQKVMELLKHSFRPEFLNRLDETIIFSSLGKDEIGKIVKLQLADLRKRLEDQGLGLELTDGAIAKLAEIGFDPVYGARPIRRAIQRELETPIARAIIAGKYPEGSTIYIADDLTNSDSPITK